MGFGSLPPRRSLFSLPPLEETTPPRRRLLTTPSSPLVCQPYLSHHLRHLRLFSASMPWPMDHGPPGHKASLAHLLHRRPLPLAPGACAMEMLRAPCASARRQCLCNRSQVVVLPILPVRIRRLGRVKVSADFHSSICSVNREKRKR